MNKLYTACIWLCCCSIQQQAVAFDLSDVQIPGNAESVWVGRGVEHNGVSMDIRTLTTRSPSDQVITFYRNLWDTSGGEGVDFTTGTAGDFKVISTLKGDHNVVVQVRDNSKGYAEGFISSMDMSTLSNSDAGEDFPALSSTVHVSKTESSDTGKYSVTRVLMNSHSVKSNADFYESRFQSDGWKKTFSKNESASFLAFFSKNNQTMEIGINKKPGKETVIFVNVVDES